MRGRDNARSAAGDGRTSSSFPADRLWLDRRKFLLLGASTLALSACQVDPKSAIPSVTVVPRSEFDIDALMSTSPFYIAHRGSGDNWVEHSLDAYSHSVRLGVKAIEVSVNATSDGKLVCHHDISAKRLTGKDVKIADVSYSTLSGMLNDSRDWLGPAAKPQPIPLLKDVLDRFAGSHVIFIEDKQGTNARAMLDLMSSYQNSRTHLVWKQWAGADQHALAKSAGYKTWGYFTEDLFPRADELASRFDYLGANATATDGQVSKLVSYGKPVIAWEIHYRSMRDRMERLGVSGMMCSNLPYVTTAVARSNRDAFSTGLRAAGDLPWTTDLGPVVQPLIDKSGASVTLAHPGIQSYLMGSMCPIPERQRTIGFELRWPKQLPKATEHAGIAFGLGDDRPYRVGVVGEVAGYHVIIRANGSVELFSRPAGTAAGVLIGSMQTDAPRAGDWIPFQVNLRPAQVTVLRLDGDAWSLKSDASIATGGYLWLCKNYADGPAVEFRSLVTA